MDLPPSPVPDFSSSVPLATTPALLEALPWGVLVLDAQDIIQYINQQAIVWCGPAAEALQGQLLAQAPLPPALGALLQQLQPEILPHEVWLPGTQQWLSVRATPNSAGQRWFFLENVTASKQVEADRQRSSQLLLDMEAVAHIGSYEADLRSSSFYFSDGMYQLFGEAPQAFVPTLELIDARSHPDDAATVRQVLDEAVRTQQPYTYRRRIRRADGQWRTLEVHGEVRADTAGNAVQLRGLVQDITERVQAEGALHDSSQLLRATIDSSLDMVQVFEAVRDERGKVVDFTWVLNNASAERQYGNVIGQRLCQLNPGVVKEGIFDTFQQVLETGVPDQREHHYVHEQFDGWFYQSTVRLGDGVTTTTHDITDRKRMEQELRDSKTLLQDIINAPSIGIAVYRAVRAESGEIIDFAHEYINRASVAMLGEDFTGKLLSDHGDHGTSQLQLFTKVLARGQGNAYVRQIHFRGRQVWFAITNTPLDGDRLVHTWEDVTERQQAEAEIIRLKEEVAQQATDKYRALFRSMDQGFCVLEMLFDDSGKQAIGFDALEVNPRFAQESGMSAFVAGETARELVPTLDDFWLAAYGQVVRTGEAQRQERYEPQVNRWFDVHAFRIGPPTAHQVAVLFTDITARKQTEERLRRAAAADAFRLQLADTLDPLSNPAAIQEAVTHLACQHFEADHCYYCEIFDGQAIIQRDAATEGLPSVAGTYLIADFTLLQAVVEAGRPFAVRDVREDENMDDNLRQLCGQLQVISYLNIPVVKDGHTAGVLCLVQRESRQWTADEAALATEVAERTWVAVTRARTEEALRKSEERLRLVTDAMPALISYLDAGLIYRFANQHYQAWFGRAPEEILGQHVRTLLGAAAFERLRPHAEKALAGERQLFEAKMPFREGGTRHVHTEFVPDVRPDGSVAGYYSLVVDLTARKQAEEALRLSEERLRALVTNLPGAAVFVVGPDLRYQLAEGEALYAAGFEPASLLGRTLGAALPPNLVAEHERHYRLALAGHSFSLEHKAHGHTYISRGVPLLDAAGQVDSVLVVSYDITERKQAEEALRASEEQFRTVANLVPDLLWRSTPDSNTAWYNQQWYEYTGQPPEDAAGYGWTDVIHPDDRAGSARRYQDAVTSGQFLRQEHRIRSAQGEYRWFQVQIRPVRNERDEIVTWFGAATDIHDRKQAELYQRQTEEHYRQQLEQQVLERTQQLQESRDLLQSVLDTSLISMSVLYAVRDETGQVQDFRLGLVNKELERETGRTDLMGKRYAQEYPGIRQVGIFELMLKALATDEPQSMEYFYDQDGFIQWYACQFVKLDDGLVATNLDITERKIAEQELLKNLRLLEQAEAVAGLGSWDYDLATGIMRWSDGMHHLVNLPLGQPVSFAVYLQLVVDDDRPRAEQLVRQLTAGKSAEDTLRLRVGEQVKTVRLKAVVLHDEAGQPARVLGVDLDISKLQRLEADNLRLRLGQQQALFEAVQAAQEAERKRLAEGLHNGIGQLLFATKLRLDRLPLLLADFGLKAALQDIGSKMSSPPLRLHCQVLLDEEIPLTPALQLSLYRMAQELAQNILKHAHGATEASLELETIPGWVLLRAEDNGPGFSSPPTSQPGLGLRSIRDQVMLLRGQVEIGSFPSGGAHVRIRIPLLPSSVSNA